jgi:hypothetical protein
MIEPHPSKVTPWSASRRLASSRARVSCCFRSWLPAASRSTVQIASSAVARLWGASLEERRRAAVRIDWVRSMRTLT